MVRHLTEGQGHLPAEWIRSELAVLDNVAGDIAALSDRIAAARTWTYVAHRNDWLEDAPGWAERARQVEDKLSDALHQRLTQRFVDRRTAVLLKDLKLRDPDLRVEVDPDGAVVVDGAIIGTLKGFAFLPDPAARAGEKKLLLAAAERRLASELALRARALGVAPDAEFALAFEGGMPPRLTWKGFRVAALRRGRDTLNPRIELDRSLDTLEPAARAAVLARLTSWTHAAKARQLAALTRLEALKPGLSPAARGLVVQLTETMGCLPRATVASLLASLTREDRRALARAGVRLGVCHVYAADALRPEATRWRLALWGVATGVSSMPEPPRPGLTSLRIDPAAPPGFYAVAGFWALGPFAIRVDMADRTARAVHAQRLAERAGAGTIRPDPALMTSLGLGAEDFARLMQALGFRGATERGFAFAPGRSNRPKRRARSAAPADSAALPFAHLSALMTRRDPPGDG
jgi:ATP-dependent RNA helicase SUPV3L1/SUV3